MVTYRRDLERKGWHRPWPLRAFLLLLGPALTFLGLVFWSLEETYGGDEDRKEYITFHQAGGPVQVLDGSQVVFEGTQEEVDAWLEAERGSRNFTVALVTMAVGALAILAAVAPSPKKRPSDRNAPPADEIVPRPMQLT